MDPIKPSQQSKGKGPGELLAGGKQVLLIIIIIIIVIIIIIIVIVIVIITSVGHPHHSDDHVIRSATIVLAFLLQHEAMSLQDAIKQVKY